MLDIVAVLALPLFVVVYHFSTYSRRGRRWGQF